MAINKFIAGALTAAAMAFGATTASAVTIIEDATFVTDSQTGSATTLINGLDADINFDWTASEVTQYVSFTVGAAFDLFFTGYTDRQGAIASPFSSFTLDVLDGQDGMATSRLTNATSSCNTAAGPIAGNCTHITNNTATGGSAATAERPDSVVPLFAGLSAGSYRLGVYERGFPNDAAVSFAIAAVPLPAGLILILSGLGVMGLVARRKTA